MEVTEIMVAILFDMQATYYTFVIDHSSTVRCVRLYSNTSLRIYSVSKSLAYDYFCPYTGSGEDVEDGGDRDYGSYTF